MIQAIYKLKSKSIDTFYIGSTTNLQRRFSNHIYKLKRGFHENSRLQDHYNKYGKEDLVAEVVSEFNNEIEMRKEETELILNTKKELLFNIAGFKERKRKCERPMRKRTNLIP